MRRLTIQVLLWSALATPMLAQTKIGGGSCNSASLTGNYAVSITGRQVTAAGTFTNVFQAIGAAAFDGLNKVNITLTADTMQSVNSPLTWAGTYSVQANCAGVITITTGGSATLNLVVYSQGSAFLVTGNDNTYFYSGSGNDQPNAITKVPANACPIATLSGSYTFNGTGYGLSATSVSGVSDAAGILQFDGEGKVTANVTVTSGSTSSTTVSATGSYSVAANCLGSATLTDSKGARYALNLSPTAANSTATTDVLATFAQGSKFIIDGAAHTVANDTCSAASLNGTFALNFNGRAISSAGSFAGSFQSNGTATFDGQGKVVLAGTSNTNLGLGRTYGYTGTYTLPASCVGTVSLNTGSAANFTLVEWSGGRQFNIVGADSTYVYSGGGSVTRPSPCGNATLSGEYVYDASGFLLSGTAETGIGDESGVLQFDGQGNVTATYNVTSLTPGSFTASGTYSVGANCLGTASLVDSAGKTNAVTFSILGLYGQNVDLIESNPQFVRTGGAHSAIVNPTQAIGNVASYTINYTPPGSVFVLFGENLATRAISATNTPLPVTLGSTSVTVNGEPAPLFYVDPGQIDAQMPWDIPGGTLATVIVKNGTTTSNAAAVYVPGTGTPGISFYSNNRAVVVNSDGSVNSPSAAASIGEEVVAYFTGGGPVQAAGKLTTGSPSPNGLSPVTGSATMTVGTANATIKYIGLTPGAIGLYQVNFIVPSLPKGTYPVVINIAGQDSNNPVMTIAN